MAKPVLQDSYDPISKSELEAFEDKLGIKLPNDYRSFLLEHNGGDYPFEVSTSFGPSDPRYTIVKSFYPLFTDEDSLLAVSRRVNSQLPQGFLPIGTDGMGNHICLVFSEQDKGSIWFWDHELSQKGGWPPLNSDRLANHFTEFYDSLEYYLPFCEEDWQETSPAFMAAERGDANALSSILDDGFDIESRNNRGQTLLICAASARQSQNVRLLLERGASIESRDNEGQTALLAASSSHSFDSAKLLVAAGADLDARNGEGETPLLAAMAMSYRLPLYLIEEGANVNLRNNYGNSPLEMCELYEAYLREPLLQAGAVE